MTLVATGCLLDVAVKAADILLQEGISAEIINIATIKPLDREIITKSVQKTGKAVVMEEGIVVGGLGSAVAAALSETCPVPMAFIGMDDTFGQNRSKPWLSMPDTRPYTDFSLLFAAYTAWAYGDDAGVESLWHNAARNLVTL